jgi:dTMP kinase
VTEHARGRFLVLDGPEGAGKTTQAERLVEGLRAAGRPAALVRDPGSTPVSERIRRILLDPAVGEMDVRTELFLYMASRSEMVAQLVAPALARGETVVSDRFVSSTVAYQGYAGGLDPEVIWQVWGLVSGGIDPDLTVILDLDVDKGFTRIHGKKVLPDGQVAFSFLRDRMEAKDRAYHEKVRQGFLAMARARPDRFAVVDASRSPDEVAEAIREAVARVLR